VPQLPATAKQISGFGAVGALTFAANLAVTAGLHELAGLNVEISYAGGYTTALFVSFLLCRYTIFSATTENPFRQFAIFAISSILFRGLEYIASVLCYKFFGMQYLLAMVLVQSLTFIIKFFYYRTVVFSDDKNSSA
jgi:putative flippase GtrA